MSALPPKADIGTQPRDVRFVPIGDIIFVIRGPHRLVRAGLFALNGAVALLFPLLPEFARTWIASVLFQIQLSDPCWCTMQKENQVSRCYSLPPTACPLLEPPSLPPICFRRPARPPSRSDCHSGIAQRP